MIQSVKSQMINLYFDSIKRKQLIFFFYFLAEFGNICINRIQKLHCNQINILK